MKRTGLTGWRKEDEETSSTKWPGTNPVWPEIKRKKRLQFCIHSSLGEAINLGNFKYYYSNESYPAVPFCDAICSVVQGGSMFGFVDERLKTYQSKTGANDLRNNSDSIHW